MSEPRGYVPPDDEAKNEQEALLQQTREEATKVERERCRTEEVEPLITVLRVALEWLIHCPVSSYNLVGKRHADGPIQQSPDMAIKRVLAAVEAKQEENPND